MKLYGDCCTATCCTILRVESQEIFPIDERGYIEDGRQEWTEKPFRDIIVGECRCPLHAIRPDQPQRRDSIWRLKALSLLW